MGQPDKQAGFTLVELAIVLTIIGLLIGGILKGQELIMNARLTATIRQVESYRAASQTFFDTFAGLPGDLRTANTRIPDCDPAHCQGGDGDSTVGVWNPAQSGLWHQQTYPAWDDERTQFWRHLFLADLITGIGTGIVPVWGETHPKSEYGAGGFQIARSDVNGGDQRFYYRMQMQIMGTIDAAGGAHPISPSRMRIMDSKFDDGRPYAGDVLALNPQEDGTLCTDANGAVSEYLVNNDAHCMPFFRMGSGY